MKLKEFISKIKNATVEKGEVKKRILKIKWLKEEDIDECVIDLGSNEIEDELLESTLITILDFSTDASTYFKPSVGYEVNRYDLVIEVFVK